LQRVTEVEVEALEELEMSYCVTWLDQTHQELKEQEE
jgi:hypothetical protein